MELINWMTTLALCGLSSRERSVDCHNQVGCGEIWLQNSPKKRWTICFSCQFKGWSHLCLCTRYVKVAATLCRRLHSQHWLHVQLHLAPRMARWVVADTRKLHNIPRMHRMRQQTRQLLPQLVFKQENATGKLEKFIQVVLQGMWCKRQVNFT